MFSSARPSSVNSNASRALVFPSTSSTTGHESNSEIKTFCQEGTPSWRSKSNSHENLSNLSAENDFNEPIVSERETEVFHGRETGRQNYPDDSDSSDASADEELLQNVIKSAWEHNRNVAKVHT